MQKIILLFMLACNCMLQAQTLKGTVVDDTSGKPINQAQVFFDNTTITTETNNEGVFEIEVPSQASNQLIVVADGYDYHILTNVTVETNLLIRLKKEDNILDEMVIDKSPFTRKEMLKAFKTYFLGTTPNGKSAKIKNEDVIYFNYNIQTNTLTAYSDKPIEIENKNLGYLITFYLQKFEVKFNTQSLEPFNYLQSYFSGYTQFKDVLKVTKKHHKNRTNTSLLSYTNFFRELINDYLEKEIFILAVDRFKVDPKEYFKISQNNNGFNVCLIKNPTKDVPEYNNGKQGYKQIPTYFNVLHLATQKQSIFEFNANCVLIDEFGNLVNPEQISFGGYFGDLKIADMLPLDYYKNKIKK